MLYTYMTTQKRYIYKYHSFATTVSQLKICDFFQENLLKILKCYNFLWVQRRHNCSPAASFAICVMTLYLLKVHLQTFLSLSVTQKCQMLGCDTLVANERYVASRIIIIIIVIIICQHVSVTPVIISRVSYDKNTVNIK